MKLLKKILMTFIWIILILLVTFNVYNFVSIKILHKELPKVFGYSILEVVSGSMEPTIMVGDLIVIDTNCTEYKKGDIITFRDVNGSFVTHRIIEIGVDEMVTKGDNNDSLDDPMSPATIVGKYVTRVPQLGSVMSSLKNPLVMALILAIGIIVCFLVSTDKDLKPKLTDEEKEFLEFKKLKEEEKKKTETVIVDDKKVTNAKLEGMIVERDELVERLSETVKAVPQIQQPKKNITSNNRPRNNVNYSSRNRVSNNKRYSNQNNVNKKYNSQHNKTNTSANNKARVYNNNRGNNNYTQQNNKRNNNGTYRRNQTNNNNNRRNNNYTQNRNRSVNSRSTNNK